MNQSFAIQYGAVTKPANIAIPGHSALLDAFGRQRVSVPFAMFDSQFTYNLGPLLYEQTATGVGATITHDTTNRSALLAFAATPAGGAVRMQTFEYFRYQPGRSQQILLTFNFISSLANCVKGIGYSDGTNGIELQWNNQVAQFVIFSGTGAGTQTAVQSSWNVDKLDGLGPSGVTLDLTKEQVFVIDFQALYSGRVRLGFDFGDGVVYAHEFHHANVIAFPYLQDANLPVRAYMTCSAETTTSMRFICCSVISESGELDALGYTTSRASGNIAVSNGARTHMLSIRPKTTFNAIANRTGFRLESVEIVNTGVQSLYWELVIGQAISGATGFTDVNATYSAFEYNSTGTISGSPALVIQSGYCAGNKDNSVGISRVSLNRAPITLDAAAAVRALGTLSLIATGLGGATTAEAALNWKEIR